MKSCTINLSETVKDFVLYLQFPKVSPAPAKEHVKDIIEIQAIATTGHF